MKQKKFVEYIVKLIVDKPERVEVSVREGEKTNVIEVQADLDDYGKVIGKKGRFINAVRILLAVISREDKKRWVIDVPDKEDRVS